MKTGLVGLVAAMATCWLAMPLAAAQSAADAVAVQGAYARAVPPGQPNSAAFMALHNGSAAAHALVGAASPVAKTVELHSHTMDNGMMRMRQVPAIDIPAGETATLRPGGLHVMLIGLDHQLMPGETVELTLEYADGSRETVSAPVRKVKPMMMNHDHHDHH